MNEIKAIETEYNGYRFRSRLEARWAVFFDAMGIKYEYEPEGYVLQDGERYLPDFRLHVRHRSSTDENEPVYAEVKGVLSPKDKKKCDEFSKFYPLILLGNIPADANEYMGDYCKFNDEFFSYWFIDGDPYCALFSIHQGEPWVCGVDHEQYDNGESMNKALTKARQARFEHGEKPNKTPDLRKTADKLITEARRRQLFSRRFAEAFAISKWSFAQLGIIANVDRSEFTKWLSGCTMPDELCIVKLARALNVSADWLYGNQDNFEDYQTYYKKACDFFKNERRIQWKQKRL